MDTSKDFDGEAVPPDRGPNPGLQEVRAALDRLLESRAFRSAHGQREFLRFTVQETLAGRGHNLKEFVVGAEAFGRGDRFDPRVDPIVRTEARKLRIRLARFYDGEGSADPVRIELHKGSYTPTFHYARAASEPEAAPLEEALPFDQPTAPHAASIPAPESDTISRLFPRWTPVFYAASALVVTACVLIWSHKSDPGLTTFRVASVSVVNRSGDSRHDVLSAQIAASVRRALVHQQDLRLASRDQLSGKNETLAELHCTLNKSGEGLRLRLQLLNMPRRSLLWSGSYELQPAEQREVGIEVASEIRQVLVSNSPKNDGNGNWIP
ncbi:MAG: hypothetical protein H7Y20_13060 [Bryobacteraceae bacterium]|nr:hypothetical protein [Bryobacteraceae bacterium]